MFEYIVSQAHSSVRSYRGNGARDQVGIVRSRGEAELLQQLTWILRHDR